MRTRTFCLLTALAISVSACGGGKLSSPKGATLGSSYAEITFERGISGKFGFGYALTQGYSVGEMPKPKTAAIFGWMSKSSKVILFPAGERVQIIAGITMSYGAPGITASGSNGCTNIARFTPQPNKRYRVLQTGSGSGPCSLSIIDVATGLQPDDVEDYRFTGSGS